MLTALMLLQLIEAVVLPMTHKDRFQALGIQPPKGLALTSVLTSLLATVCIFGLVTAEKDSLSLASVKSRLVLPFS